MYSPSTTSWIYISDLPAPHYNTTVAVLSSTEILVIGDLNDSDDYAVNTTKEPYSLKTNFENRTHITIMVLELIAISSY